MYVLKLTHEDGRIVYWTPDDWVKRRKNASRFTLRSEARAIQDYWLDQGIVLRAVRIKS